MRMVPQRIKVYKYLAEQKYSTLTDLQKYLGTQASRESLRVSLYQFGLSRFSYPAIPQGVWYIKNQSLFDELYTYYPNDPFYRVSSVCMNEIEHALGMNKIRQAVSLQLGPKLLGWRSEYYLKALPAYGRMRFSYTMIPDAVVLREQKDGGQAVNYIEYERTLKSPQRYKDIFASYQKRDDVADKSVIYVCQNEYIRQTLGQISV